jgi:superfamily II DNA helicase RecQ
LQRCCSVCDKIDWIKEFEQYEKEKVFSVPSTRSSKHPKAKTLDPPSMGVKGGGMWFIGGKAEAIAPGGDSFETLKRWRLARAGGKPAYTVCSDRALGEIAGKKPGCPEELLEIHGIGPSFLQNHASSLMQLLKGENPPPLA